ncbi:MAG: DUF29 domain-containing protein [Deltaproteobacteria bacterium]|jgi:uncharacterized protein YhdP|nr:DUF29 domain-containing protein [Deltaproteobacteria bacterium]
MSLYETDFYAWLKEQAQALRERNFTCLDVDNLVEEVDGMGASLKRELKSRLHTLVVHLLKWHLLPRDRRRHERGWKLTVIEQRYEIESLLEESPSLKRYLPECLASAWHWARRDAAVLRPEARLAETCPWNFEEIMHHDFQTLDAVLELLAHKES